MFNQQKIQIFRTSKPLALSKKNIDSMLKGEGFSLLQNYLQRGWSSLINNFETLSNKLLEHKIIEKLSLNSLKFSDKKNVNDIEYKKYIIPSFCILFVSIFFNLYPFNYENNMETWFGIIIGIEREYSIINFLHFEIVVVWFFLGIYLFIFISFSSSREQFFVKPSTLVASY